MRTARDGDTADLRVSGSAGELYLLMWNRDPGPGVRLAGDDTVLERWREACQINWI